MQWDNLNVVVINFNLSTTYLSTLDLSPFDLHTYHKVTNSNFVYYRLADAYNELLFSNFLLASLLRLK